MCLLAGTQAVKERMKAEEQALSVLLLLRLLICGMSSYLPMVLYPFVNKNKQTINVLFFTYFARVE